MYVATSKGWSISTNQRKCITCVAMPSLSLIQASKKTVSQNTDKAAQQHIQTKLLCTTEAVQQKAIMFRLEQLTLADAYDTPADEPFLSSNTPHHTPVTSSCFIAQHDYSFRHTVTLPQSHSNQPDS
jgi:hypothetical protein